jgi:hypothetical protein
VGLQGSYTILDTLIDFTISPEFDGSGAIFSRVAACTFRMAGCEVLLPPTLATAVWNNVSTADAPSIRGNRYVLGPGGAFTQNVNGSAKVLTASGWWALGFDQSTIAGVNYRDVVLADTPVAYWRLGELAGTSANDETGNGHIGTYTGSALVQGQPSALLNDTNAAVKFTGASGNYVDIPDASALNFGTGSFTAECWLLVPATQFGNYGVPIGKSDGTTGWRAFILANGGLGLCWGTNGNFFTDSYTINNSAPRPYQQSPGRWAYCVWGYDAVAGNVFYNINGVTVTAAQTAHNVSNAAVHLLIGSWSTDLFAGLLDEVAIYPYALTSAQMTAHYKAAATKI